VISRRRRWINRAKRGVTRRHSSIARFLPKGHRAYRFPGGRIFVDLRESPKMLQRVLGIYEPRKTNALQTVLRPGMTFLDIGANHGDFSLLAAKFMNDQGTVLAFEPAPDNANWLRKSVEANGCKSIEVLELALGDADGEAELLLTDHSGWQSFVAIKKKTVTGTVKVPTRRLDALLAERGIDAVDVIKIDVEGFETQVLDGGEKTLTAPGRRVLLLDLHPPIVDPVELGHRLESLGYSLCKPWPPFKASPPLDMRTKELVAIKER
jgi:FkbM family methyltransferase